MALPALKTVSEIYDIGSGLDDRQITDAEYECIGIVSEKTLEYLANYRFGGDVYAYPDGEIYFPSSPIMQVSGTLRSSLEGSLSSA